MLYILSQSCSTGSYCVPLILWYYPCTYICIYYILYKQACMKSYNICSYISTFIQYIKWYFQLRILLHDWSKYCPVSTIWECNQKKFWFIYIHLRWCVYFHHLIVTPHWEKKIVRIRQSNCIIEPNICFEPLTLIWIKCYLFDASIIFFNIPWEKRILEWSKY